jgi:hypothetical protein
MENEFNFTLWKPKKESKARFVPLADVPGFGYRGVYNVRESDATQLEEHGIESFRGTVHSDMLLVDCDSFDAADYTQAALEYLGLAFTRYFTGNRGAHFEIQRFCTPTHLLPQFDKAWVKAHLPHADLSLYTPLHIIRVEGSVHELTGQKKTFELGMTGTALEFPKNLPAEKMVPTPEIALQGLQCVFLDRFLMINTTPLVKGENTKGRHSRLCSVAARLRDLGQPEMFALGWLMNLNLMYEPSVEKDELERIVRWAYSK